MDCPLSINFLVCYHISDIEIQETELVAVSLF